MSETGFVLLSALLLAVPVGIKYLLAFQTRHLVVTLKRREREVQQLAVQLEAAERECLVVSRAVRQVDGQRRQALVRQERVGEKLEQARRDYVEEMPIAV